MGAPVSVGLVILIVLLAVMLILAIHDGPAMPTDDLTRVQGERDRDHGESGSE